MSTMHYNEYDPDRHDHLPPPEPPKLMKLDIFSDGAWQATYQNVTNSSLASPTAFRFETLDGKIRVFDMPGRDFVLAPQES